MAGVRFDQVQKRYADGTLAVKRLDLDVSDGEFTVLVGPSGCGKTTALRMLAGLDEPTSGTISIGSRAVNGTEPGRRDVSMVFQSYALFPHLTVYENIAFPLRMRGIGRSEVDAAVHDAARLLDLTGLLGRRPNQLSGGQRQRVAMGRAVVRRPAVYLMDEPLSNLDAKLRSYMRAELAKLHQRLGVTTIYVTHDQTEAMTLGTRVVVMRDGLVQQHGTPRELYWQPSNTFVARFIGTPMMNLMAARAEHGVLSVPSSSGTATAGVHGAWGDLNDDVWVGVRADKLRIGSSASDRELTIRGIVENVEDLGSEQIVYFIPDVAAIASDDENAQRLFTARVGRTKSIRPGDRVDFVAAADSLFLFAQRGGAAIAVPS